MNYLALFALVVCSVAIVSRGVPSPTPNTAPGQLPQQLSQLGNLNSLLGSYGNLDKLMQSSGQGGDIMSTVQSGLINSNSNVRTSSNSIGNKSTNNINNVSSKTVSNALTKQMQTFTKPTTKAVAPQKEMMATQPDDDDDDDDDDDGYNSGAQYQPTMVASNTVNPSPVVPTQQNIINKQLPSKAPVVNSKPTQEQVVQQKTPATDQSIPSSSRMAKPVQITPVSVAKLSINKPTQRQMIQPMPSEYNRNLYAGQGSEDQFDQYGQPSSFNGAADNQYQDDDYQSDDEETYQPQPLDASNINRKHRAPITKEQVELKHRLLDLYEKATNEGANFVKPSQNSQATTKVYKEHLGKVLKALSPRKLASEKVKNVLLSDPLDMFNDSPYHQTEEDQTMPYQGDNDPNQNYQYEEESFVSQHSGGPGNYDQGVNQEEYQNNAGNEYPAQDNDYEQEESRMAEMKQVQIAGAKNQLDETLNQLVPHLQSQFTPEFIDSLNEIDDRDLSPIELVMKKLITCSLNPDQCTVDITVSADPSKSNEDDDSNNGAYNTFTPSLDNPYINDDRPTEYSGEEEYQNQPYASADNSYETGPVGPFGTPFSDQNREEQYHPRTSANSNVYPPVRGAQNMLSNQIKQPHLMPRQPSPNQAFYKSEAIQQRPARQQQSQMARPAVPQQSHPEYTNRQASSSPVFPSKTQGPNRPAQQRQPQPMMQNNAKPMVTKNFNMPMETSQGFRPLQQMASAMKKMAPSKILPSNHLQQQQNNKPVATFNSNQSSAQKISINSSNQQQKQKSLSY